MAANAIVVAVDNDSETIDRQWSMAVRGATLKMIGQTVTSLSMGSLDAALRCHKEGLRFDSIFIDASHEYAECRADIQAWMPLVRSGGIIAGHDYWAVHTGVMDAVNDVFQENFDIVPNTRIWHARK